MHQKKTLTIVLPTYNESENVGPIIKAVKDSLEGVDILYDILFVDDSSDKTPAVIAQEGERDGRVRLIHRQPKERTGLATALVLGMESATGDYICCLDADLQHPPEVIPKLLYQMLNDRADIAVASRYQPGGSAVGLGGSYRRFASHVCRYSAWAILPSVRKSTDPGSGFYMVRKDFLKTLSFQSLRGFKILIDILARSPRARVTEYPYVFRSRENDTSKATLKQGLLFYVHIATLFLSQQLPRILRTVRNVGVLILIASIFYVAFQHTQTPLEVALLSFAFILFLQGVFIIFLMVYAWENPERIARDKAPETFMEPYHSFTLLIPARHEERVIADTIRSVARINYPADMVETFILINDQDDDETIAIAQKTIDQHAVHNMKLVTFSGPLGKTYGLNEGLRHATHDIVTIFDAEDEMHADILHVANTTMVAKNADVVQSGVQLMNYTSSWYALFNVMEYFFWFKSALHFFADNDMIPLGGNTVFFKRNWLHAVEGWKNGHLTEDADIGIRLSLAGARTSVVYDAHYATHEETPSRISDFIKQRTRWNQGFMRILFAGEWLRFPLLRQKVLAFYVFFWVVMQGLVFLFIPFSIFAAFFVDMPPVLSIVTNLPLYALVVLFVIINIGIYDFIKSYNMKYSPLLIVKSAIFFIPFQLLLGVSSFRALWRELIIRDQTWEKTPHFNIGRGRENKVEAQS